LKEIWMGIVCHKQKCQMNHRAHMAQAERVGFNPLQS
jgi:hypothetical protein